MENGRCPICDGPISQGRCKFCGMPYRKDELLYHLNENLDDHYRHATPKARAILNDLQTPAGSRPTAAKTASGSSKAKSAAYQKTRTQTKTSAQPKASTQAKAVTPERTTSQKLSDQKEALKKAQHQSRTYQAFGSSTRKKKKGRLIRWIILLIFLSQVLPAVIGSLAYSDVFSQLKSFISQEDSVSNMPTEEQEIETSSLPEYYSYTTYVASTWPGRDPLVVGTDIPVGSYIFIPDFGNASVLVKDANGGSAVLSVSAESQDLTSFTLTEGMEVSLKEWDYENTFVDIRYVDDPEGSAL
ncbi:MAG: hypothetical protein Q4D55_11650 [Eubacteriales bacterium]|nr:hypothetical protein [Eubacteriales bacterium]